MNIAQYVVTDPGEADRHRVRHRVLGTAHILELLPRDRAHDETSVATFIELARARAVLRHPNLLGVDDCGRTRDGRWFVVSTAPTGGTLADLGQVAPAVALAIVAQLANAIEAAYTRGVAPATLARDRIALAPPHHPTILDLRVGIPDPADDARTLAAIAAELAPDAPAIRRDSPRELVHALAAAIDGGLDIVHAYAPELLDDVARASVRPRATLRYRRGDRIGIGGMAEVFRGTTLGAEGFSRAVAIKCVLPHLSDAREFTARFIAEARIASRLAHPNIVSVIDFDRDDDDRLFLVMELVDGVSLDTLAASGPLPPNVARFVAVEVLRGLGFAHASADGVVHRDVSPQNILVGWEGCVKVTDFGIAKVREARDANLHGKPGYNSPEQAAGAPVDGRCDLYALGVVLWELVTGERFTGESAQAIRAEIPASVDAVIARLVAVDPADRYATAADAIEALAACPLGAGDGRVELTRVLARRFTRTGRQKRIGSQTITRFHRRASRPRRVRPSRLALVIVLAVCAILGVGLGALIGRG